MSSMCICSQDLEPLSPVQKFNSLTPETDHGGDKITAQFLDSINQPDSLDTFLDFLKGVESPVSSVLDLRSLLVAQKEEKIALQSLVDQMRLDMQGIR